MKKIRSYLFLPVIVLTLSLASAENIFSQGLGDSCVKCVPAGQGWTCMAAASGGEACTPNGFDCTLTVICPSLNGAPCSLNAQDPTKPRIILNIPDRIIREVGKVNLRLAQSLLTLRKLPPHRYSEGIINSAPVELTETDIEEQLASTGISPEFLLRLRERMDEAFKKGLLPTVYNFSIQPASEPDTYVLKIQTAEVGSFGSPASIEINLSETAGAMRRSKEPTRLLNAGSWKIE